MQYRSIFCLKFRGGGHNRPPPIFCGRPFSYILIAILNTLIKNAYAQPPHFKHSFLHPVGQLCPMLCAPLSYPFSATAFILPGPLSPKRQIAPFRGRKENKYRFVAVLRMVRAVDSSETPRIAGLFPLWTSACELIDPAVPCLGLHVRMHRQILCVTLLTVGQVVACPAAD